MSFSGEDSASVLKYKSHRAFGGDVADSLQQVPHLANPSHVEENLRMDVLLKRGQGRDYSIWSCDLRGFLDCCEETTDHSLMGRDSHGFSEDIDGRCYIPNCLTETQSQLSIICIFLFCLCFLNGGEIGADNG